ncbi:linoleate 9S-lipoxygenase [Trifolium repens]|nr:linoleate 9S-lipoxygenase [Trifolium repens]
MWTYANVYRGGHTAPNSLRYKSTDSYTLQDSYATRFSFYGCWFYCYSTFRLVILDFPSLLKYPAPHIIQVDKSAWMTNEEFAREMLAGVNPCVIQRLQQFPPQSKLDPKDYGDQTSTITKQHLEINMDGLSVEKAIQDERLFILDYHDAFLPYLDKRTNRFQSLTQQGQSYS